MINGLLTQLGIVTTQFPYITLILEGVIGIIIITEVFSWLKAIFQSLGGR